MKHVSIALFIGLAMVRLAAAADKPNFIILFADDLGYGDLSCYGSQTIRTPRIDRMAVDGIRFTDFYATAPFCSPSRASLLTGRYPARCGVPNVLFPIEKTGLPADEITIAEILKLSGYATACIGKWHLGMEKPFHPNSQGFDLYVGQWTGGQWYRQEGQLVRTTRRRWQRRSVARRQRTDL